MCGIIAVQTANAEKTKEKVLKRYHKQKTRGQDGFGYIAIDNWKIKSVTRKAGEKDIKDALEKETAPFVIFHHRFPTSTINLAELAHPITVRGVSDKHTYYVVHNGVISNARELKEAHKKAGIKYTTSVRTQKVYKIGKQEYESVSYAFNDSEALAIECALFLEGKKNFIDARGSVAVIIVQADKNKNVKAIYYGTNGGNPLTYDIEGGNLRIASEGYSKSFAPMYLYKHTPNTDKMEMLDFPIDRYGVPNWREQYPSLWDSAETERYTPEDDVETLEELQADEDEMLELADDIDMLAEYAEDDPQTMEELLAKKARYNELTRKYA